MPRLRLRRITSLRGQLTLLVAALALPLFALQLWAGYREYSGARARAEVDATAFADATNLGVTQFFATSEDLLRSMTTHFGGGWIADGECVADMLVLTQLFPFLVNAITVDASGAIVCSALPGPTGVSAAEWTWLPRVLQTGEFTVGNPILGNFSQRWILPMAVPLLDSGGEVIGAVVGAVSLLELSRYFGDVALPDDYLVTVATKDRVVVARSHDADDWVGRPLPENTGSDRLLRPGRSVATGPDLNGVHRTWGQLEIDDGWLVFVGVPDDAVYGPAIAEAVRNALISLLIIVLATLLAGHSYARIASALKELAAGVRSTAKGELVQMPSGTPSEVSAVVDQFNQTLQGRDRAEAAEREARGRFQSLFDNAVFGLYVSTPDGRFLQANPALASMMGYESVEELIKVGPAALYADAQRRLEVVEESVADRRVPTCDLEWIRRDSTPISVRVGGKIVEQPDGSLAFEMIVQDVTDAKRTEEQLRQTQKMEAIGQLTGGIAHDFNNLLTVIGGNVELLEDDMADDESARRDLANISRATKRAATLTHRLLAFGRKTPHSVREVDVNDMIPDLERMLAPLIGEHVELISDLGTGPLPIAIDPGDFEQIVVNLMLNARDAMRDGGTVTLRTRSAFGPEDTSADARPGPESRAGVQLTVSDTGVGMDADTASRAFEPFFTTKPMGQGTGLGLSTVYGTTTRAGGTIDIESAVGEGTTVTIWFPRATLEPGAPMPVDDTLVATPDGERILVVEDDDLVRSFVQRSLEEVGYHVETAFGGDHALELIRAAESPFDLVLTDVVMPGLGGLDLAKQLELVEPRSLVLFMSGYLRDPFEVADFELRPELLIQKPFSPTELRARVRLLLDGRPVPS